jgi:hypothetical protein
MAEESGKLNCNKCCGGFFTYLLRLRVSPEEIEQRYKSREIDKFLNKDKNVLRRQVSVLESNLSASLKVLRPFSSGQGRTFSCRPAARLARRVFIVWSS